PPGYGKTELAVVNFIARGFAINPRSRFIHASYAQPLALDNSTKVKDVINLPGYQAHWPVRMRVDTNAKALSRTTDGGHLRPVAADRWWAPEHGRGGCADAGLSRRQPCSAGMHRGARHRRSAPAWRRFVGHAAEIHQREVGEHLQVAPGA